MTDRALQDTANALMRAVVASKAIRTGTEHYEGDLTVAVRVMREELKSFLDVSPSNAKYRDERAIALTGQSGLALASVIAESIYRICQERAPADYTPLASSNRIDAPA